MYYEEKIINGVLCWRGDPDGEFTPYTPEQLTEKIRTLESTVENVRTLIAKF